ncbi:hypothetical protein JM83_1495 [Gillisia sp. Hel_I_86]|uniref:hypothetical protein n=1 Tax=Gillisia sp. Hel_I_86 TaxID=1249981 RepID=UPI00119AAF8A|nr:hypothetical protein [Gillisia sp. Hel_I_86]TVZ26528.1 hypothetical protein JM83_1495 [Gillisia sp. Hel_I_86]
MTQQRRIFLTLAFITGFINLSYGQVWPYTPMIRYGNAIYLDIENKALIEREKTPLIFEKGLKNRFFDILTSKDSIGIQLKDEVVFFHQKERNEPKDSKTILFYSRRKLKNQKMTINYLKIIDVTDKIIVAEASIKYKESKNKKERIEINITDLEGIFIGPGKNLRTGTLITSLIAGTLLVIVL